jgi:teichoic acid transport system permease protein
VGVKAVEGGDADVGREGFRPVRQESVDVSHMRPVADRPPLPEYLAQLWGRRHFVRADARGRLLAGTKGNRLGAGWLALRPALEGAGYFLVFGVLLQLSRGIDNFVGYLLVGVFLFHYTTRSLMAGAQSLLNGRTLLKSFAFPRAALPLAAVTREALNMVAVLGVMLVLVLVLPPLETVTWCWLLFPLVLVLQTVFNLGIALLAARACAHVPDLVNLLSLFARFWLFGSAVFFSLDRFVEDPAVLRVLQLNPLFQVLDISRDLLLYGVSPDAWSWLVLSAWALVVLAGGVVFFWRGEESYGSL